MTKEFQKEVVRRMRRSDGREPAHDALPFVGESPRLVTRGESFEKTQENQGLAIIDWLSFTFLSEKNELDALTSLSKMLMAFSPYIYRATARKGGVLGFSHSFDIYAVGIIDSQPVSIPFGIFAYGGENQRGRSYLSISGSGCGCISAWHSFADHLSSLNDVRITRVDLAVDFFDGEIDLAYIRRAYLRGAFSSGGRRASYQDIRSSSGDTFYIGRRQNGKLCRWYEKGKSLGDMQSSWVRGECELHNNARAIPLEVLKMPTEYWLGLYKIHKSFLKIKNPNVKKIMTFRKEHEVSLDHLKKCLRNSYGRLINIISITDSEFDPDQLLRELSREGCPKRLTKTILPASFSFLGKEKNNE